MTHLSIIIPVYNVASYLLGGFECLRPLYRSDISFEIIYVNDGSTDDSQNILENIKETHSFITVVTQENQGLSGARNTALEIATGQYIQFLDADDSVDIPAILSFLETAIAAQIDVFGFRNDEVDDKNQKINEGPKFLVPYNTTISGLEALIAGYQPSAVWLFLFKASFLRGNKLRFVPKITHEDVEFMMRVMLSAPKVYFVNAVVYHYLQRTGSLARPTNTEKLKQLLFDEILVADYIRKNTTVTANKEVISTIEKNYNSVTWNLLWRFIAKQKEVDYDFKLECLKELKEKKLYPIKGSLKTTFQKLTRLFFNREWILKLLIK